MLHPREQSQTVASLLSSIVLMPRFTKTTPQIMAVSPRESSLLLAPEEEAPHRSRSLHRQPLTAAVPTLPDKIALSVGDHMSLM